MENKKGKEKKTHTFGNKEVIYMENNSAFSFPI